MAERYKQKEKPQRQTTETKTIDRVRLFYEYFLAEKVLNGFLLYRLERSKFSLISRSFNEFF